MDHLLTRMCVCVTRSWEQSALPQREVTGWNWGFGVAIFSPSGIFALCEIHVGIVTGATVLNAGHYCVFPSL